MPAIVGDMSAAEMILDHPAERQRQRERHQQRHQRDADDEHRCAVDAADAVAKRLQGAHTKNP
jgi:hypothetical protein